MKLANFRGLTKDQPCCIVVVQDARAEYIVFTRIKAIKTLYNCRLLQYEVTRTRDTNCETNSKKRDVVQTTYSSTTARGSTSELASPLASS